MIIQGASSLYQADVGRDKNLRTSLRPSDFGALGCYSKSLVSGNIAATLSANKSIFLLRWNDATRFALIRRIRAAASVTGAITTSVPFNLALFFARAFTVAPTTNIGTTGTFSGGNAKLRTAMGSSLFASSGAGMWILGTSNAGMTGQTTGDDTDPLATIVGASGQTIGNQFFGSNPTTLWDDGVDEHPIVLQAGEGLEIQNPLAGPATGTFQVAVSVDWQEVSEY